MTFPQSGGRIDRIDLFEFIIAFLTADKSARVALPPPDKSWWLPRSRSSLGGYFISYRKLEQWVAACSGLIRSCRNIKELKVVWRAIKKEAKRSTSEALTRLEQIWQQRTEYLTS